MKVGGLRLRTLVAGLKFPFTICSYPLLHVKRSTKSIHHDSFQSASVVHVSGIGAIRSHGPRRSTIDSNIFFTLAEAMLMTEMVVIS
jgi:hypothetical protein